MGNGESDRVTVGEDPSSKKRTFSQTRFVSGRKLDVEAFRWKFKCTVGESNTSKKASTRNFSILEMIKQHVSSTLDDLSSSWRRRTSWRSQTCRTGRTTCVSSKLKNPVTTQHASDNDTGFSSAQGQKNPELQQVESRQPERPLGQKNLADSSEVRRIRTSGGSWHHNIRARNPQTEKGKRKHPFQREHGIPSTGCSS